MKNYLDNEKKLIDILEEGLDWEESEGRMKSKAEMAALFFQDMVNREKGGVAPDTSGADYFFLEEFVTEEMSWDFTAIEQDFLRNCSARLPEFSEVGWYGEDAYWNQSPETTIQKRIMRLIYNGAKIGDDYCLRLIRYLYKLYYKKEYNQIKRFRKISPREIFSLAEDPIGGTDICAMGRIMGMCRFMNIELDEQCSVLYLYLEKRSQEWISYEEDERNGAEHNSELFEECLEQCEEWNADSTISNYREYRRKNREYIKRDKFVEECLRYMGYSADFAGLCKERYNDPTTQMAVTLSILKTMDSKKEYTRDEVMQYMVLYDTVSALVDLANRFDQETGYLTGVPFEDLLEDEMLFKPEAVQPKAKSSEKKDKAVEKVLTHVAPVGGKDTSEEDYIKEIESLRSRLHEKEQANKNLRELYRQSKQSQEEYEKVLLKYRTDREELIALREFAYRTELEQEPIAEDNISDIKAQIAEFDIVIIGGHINWINKMKKEFPKWMFIASDAYKTVDGKMLEGKDRVYFYTDYISHVTYGKFIAAVRERKIPFGYLGTYNMDNIIRQIYDDLEEMR
jgi:hypothetical protein